MNNTLLYKIINKWNNIYIIKQLKHISTILTKLIDSAGKLKYSYQDLYYYGYIYSLIISQNF